MNFERQSIPERARHFIGRVDEPLAPAEIRRNFEDLSEARKRSGERGLTEEEIKEAVANNQKYWEDVLRQLQNAHALDAFTFEGKQAIVRLAEEVRDLIEEYADYRASAVDRIKNRVARSVSGLGERIRGPAKKLLLYSALGASLVGGEVASDRVVAKKERAGQQQVLKAKNNQLLASLDARVDSETIHTIIGREDIPVFRVAAPGQPDRGTFNQLPPLENLERFSISPELIKRIIDETFPKGFTFGLKRVVYSDETVLAHPALGLPPGTEEAAHVTRDGELKLLHGALTSDIKWVIRRLLAHELGHNKDWLSSKDLSVQGSLNLLDLVTKRVVATDRYKSSYVESIKNSDKRKEMMLKAQEYLAEIVAAYLDGDDSLAKEDGDIVYTLISLTDPNFDVDAAKERREKIIETEFPGGEPKPAPLQP